MKDPLTKINHIMITTNQAGSSRYYKRLEVEELHRLLILLADIEISNLGDEYFIKKQEPQTKAA